MTTTDVPLVRDESWMADAVCRGQGPEAWFPNQGATAAHLRWQCAGCPVHLKCLTYALEWHERFGFFGGHSERQRRELLRQRIPAAEAMRQFDARMSTTKRPRTTVPQPDHLPGAPVSYGSYNRGCRCIGCKAFAAAYRNQWNAEQRAAKRDDARRHLEVVR